MTLGLAKRPVTTAQSSTVHGVCNTENYSSFTDGV